MARLAAVELGGTHALVALGNGTSIAEQVDFRVARAGHFRVRPEAML